MISSRPAQGLRKYDSIRRQFRTIAEDQAGLGEPLEGYAALDLDATVSYQVCSALVLPWGVTLELRFAEAKLQEVNLTITCT